jgi:hypothetical protein
MHLLADRECEPSLQVLDAVTALLDSAAASTPSACPLDVHAVLMGSATMSRLVREPGDLDISVRLRYRPSGVFTGLRGLHEHVVDHQLALTHAIMERVRGHATLRFVRFVTEWNSVLAEADRAVGNAAWSMEDIAVEHAWRSGNREIGLRAALLWSARSTLTLCHGAGAHAQIVDLSFERSIVGPGGLVDVSASDSSLWFGKLVGTDQAARAASDHEAELARLFPARYAPHAMILANINDTSTAPLRRARPMKACKLAAWLWARFGHGDRVDLYLPVLRSDTSRASGIASRLGGLLFAIRAHELAGIADDACAAGLDELATACGQAASAMPSWDAYAHRASTAAASIRKGDGRPLLWREVYDLVRDVTLHADGPAADVLSADRDLMELLSIPSP